MAYQQAIFGNGEFYHVVNRGVEKRIIFLDRRDYQRFLQTINYYRFKDLPSRFSFKNRPILLKKIKEKCFTKPLVEIICYCSMPNHFHLLLKQIEEGGITAFISKFTNSYTKYFNIRHRRVGPLFQGSFKAGHIENEEQLLHISRYIHLNPLIDYLVRGLDKYEYSSFNEFMGKNKGFCAKGYILNRFKDNDSYKKFVLDQESYGREIKMIERVLLDMERN